MCMFFKVCLTSFMTVPWLNKPWFIFIFPLLCTTCQFHGLTVFTNTSLLYDPLKQVLQKAL